jgi:hypothetical protein
MMKKPRTIVSAATKCKEKLWEEKEETLTLICGSGYHVMNSTCIHLRVRARICTCIGGGEYTKNPLEKYNNRKG